MRTALVIAVAVVACAPTYKSGPHDVFFQSGEKPKLHTMPGDNGESSDWWDEVLHSMVLPLVKVASPKTYLGLAIGTPPSLDINEFGQVPDSAWFENRIARGKITTKQIADGPPKERGPAPGPLTIISGKLQGIAPGFVVRDSRGVIFFVKFDPPAFPRLASGAEMVATRLLHAAGYHVPDNYLVDLELSRLVLDPDAKTRDHYNRTVKLGEDTLGKLYLQLNPTPEGRLRAFFSRAVPGKPLGPFRYRGVRTGDPNDTIDHQRRRSLRGLWVFSAWLGNIDTRSQNTMDTFIESKDKPGLGWIKHYLIDFGASLGSASVEEKHSALGYERRVDWREIGLRLVTFGFRDPLWFRVMRSPFREVGIFESRVFDPATWSPLYNNQAFNQADADDTLWAASILAHFTEADIEAAVSAAQFSAPAARTYVARVLRERRDKLLRYAFSRRSSLDMPHVTGGVLRLTDLIVLAQLAETVSSYEFRVRWNRTRRADRAVGFYVAQLPTLDLKPILETIRGRFGSAFDSDPYLTVTVRRVTGEDRGPPLDVVLRVSDDFVLPVATRRR